MRLTRKPLVLLCAAVILALTASWALAQQRPPFQLAWGSPGSGPGQFNEPWGIALDPTGAFVYVADRGNHRVQKFTSTGAFQREWGGAGSGLGMFAGPDAIAVDSNGDVYVADHDAFTVQRFSPDGLWLGGWITSVRSIAAQNGRVYVTDSGSGGVRVFDAGGTQLEFLPLGHGGDNQPATPWGVTLGGGNVFVSDLANSRFKIVGSGFSRNYTAALSGWDLMWCAYGPAGFLLTVISDPSGGSIMAFAQSGLDDHGWGVSGSGPGQFVRPRGIAVDAGSTVYVVDSGNNRIQRFGFGTVPALRTSWTGLKRKYR